MSKHEPKKKLNTLRNDVLHWGHCLNGATGGEVRGRQWNTHFYRFITNIIIIIIVIIFIIITIIIIVVVVTI